MSFAETTSSSSKASLSAFTTDRKGDHDNLVYGGLSNSTVPRYKLAGHGGILGLDRRYRLVPPPGTPRVIKDQFSDPSSRSGTKSLLTRPEHEAETQIRTTSADMSHFEEQYDFISLRDGSKRRRLSNRIQRTSSEQSEASASDSETSANVNPEIQQEDAFERFKNDTSRKRLIELTKLTEQTPLDANTWQALIEHHDSIGSTPALKVSIYERAMQHLQASESKDRLMIAIMRESRNVNDSKKRASVWKAVLNQAFSHRVWLEYLNFQQAENPDFSFDDCMVVYEKVWNHVAEIQSPAEKDKVQTYFIERLTAFLTDCGFTERAVAIWQAIIEITYYRESEPPDMGAFERFWDSGLARAGESEAKGWNSCEGAEMPPCSGMVSSRTGGLHSVHGWALAESTMGVPSCMPARASDDLDSDDPYRVVLFSDISSFVFYPQTDMGHQLLLNAFLCFCKMPKATASSTNDADIVLADSFLNDDFEPIQTSLPSSTPLRSHYSHSYVLDTTTFFAESKSWFTPWNSSSVKTQSLINLALQAVQQLVDVRPTDHVLAVYLLAIQLAHAPDRVRKTARKLLKTRTESLRLYNAYALIECRLGQFETAEKVWSMALKMGSSLDEKGRADTVLLWHSWIWECLDRKQFVRAKGLLHAMTAGISQLDNFDHSHVTDAEIASEQRFLQSLAMQHFEAHRYQHASLSADLIAVSVYLNSSCNLSRALQSYRPTFQLLNAYPFSLSSLTTSEIPNVWTELLHQYRARLIHLHTSSTKTYRPKDMLDHLSTPCDLFPKNSIFYSLREYYLGESGIVERLRLHHIAQPSTKVTSDSSPPSSSRPQPSLFESQRRIESELAMHIRSCSTVNSIRAAFEYATCLGSPARVCPSIWLAYIHWELSVLRSVPTMVKSVVKTSDTRTVSTRKVVNVFYDAIRACPWVKGLYMLAFAEQELREALGNEALRGIYETMFERGLRIRLDISDKLHELLPNL